MSKESTMLDTLIELEGILKLDNKDDAISAHGGAPNDGDKDPIRIKYARTIYRARSVLGFNTDFEPGALLEEKKPKDGLTALVGWN